MSELKEFLSSVQLSKHYELLQYLSRHPNVTYTLSTLDYLLPRGASLQRFPSEWVSYMMSGACANKNVEVTTAAEDEEEEEEESMSGAVPSLDEIRIICRRPEVTSLDELSLLVQSPATMPDIEGCVALHTDQVLLSTALLREAQVTGMVWFFPDNYPKRDTQSAVQRLKTPAAAMEFSEQLTRSSGIATVIVDLPPGVYIRFQLLTHRGITVQDDLCMPVRLRVGEVFTLHLDNQKDPTRHTPSGQHMRVSTALRPSSTSDAELFARSPPLVIEKRTEQNPNFATIVKMKVRAVRASTFKLLLDVNGVQSVLDMQVSDMDVNMPGILIAREREPTGFTLPPQYRLQDPSVCPSSSSSTAGGDTAAAAAGGPRLRPTARGVLPWWQSSSPLVYGVRDATYPLEDTIAAATRSVFAKRALLHEAELRATRQAVVVRSSAGTAKKRRYRRSAHQDLCNKHLVHFGLDASVPFTPKGED